MATAVTTTIAEGVGWILLDGAGQLNAIGSPTYAAIAQALREFEADDQVGAVVIHGTGRVFSAGADISEIGSFVDREQFHSYVRGFTDVLAQLAASPLPVVAAMHGAAFGGGLELALACDVRIATAGAKLGLPEAKLGVLPGAGGTQRLPRIIAPGIALEMIMTGEPISGARAHELGLVNHIADDDALIDVATAYAAKLVALARQVPRATKKLLSQTRGMDLLAGVDAEREVAADLFASPDGREGFRAFRERRRPGFTRGGGR